MALNAKTQALRIDTVTLKATDKVRVEGGLPLPEGGMSRVLSVHAKLQTDVAEAMTDAVQLAGQVQFTILYVDDGYQPQTLQSTASWQHTLPMVGLTSQQSVTAMGTLRETHATVQGNMVRVIALAEIAATAQSQQQVQAIETLSIEKGKGKGPKASLLQAQNQTLQGSSTLAYGSATRTIRDDLPLPARMPTATRILMCECRPRVLESHNSGTRVFVRGECDIDVLYVDADLKLHPVQLQMPFETGFDLRGDAVLPDDALCMVFASSNECHCTLKEDSDGQLRIVAVESILNLYAACIAPFQAQIVSDAFVPGYDMQCSQQSISMQGVPLCFQVGDELKAAITVPEGMPAVAEVICVFVDPAISQTTPQKDGVMIEGALQCRIVYRAEGEAGGLFGFSQTVPFGSLAQVPGATPNAQVEAQVSIGDTSAMLAGSFEITLKVSLFFEGSLRESCQNQIMTDAVLGDPIAHQSGVLSMLRAQQGDSLWSICKTYGISPDTFKSLNNGIADVTPGSRVIIYRQVM